jgi:hypothetical protein
LIVDFNLQHLHRTQVQVLAIDNQQKTGRGHDAHGLRRRIAIVRNKKAVGENTHGLVTVSSVYRATGALQKGKTSETPLAIRLQNMP